MQILLVALNARYVHTNLAVRYLREVLLEQEIPGLEVRIGEFSINDRLEHIAAEIYEQKPDIIGFSCYIWNISRILWLIRHLRLVLPQAYFVVGGPEVSFDPEHLLASYPQVDAVIVGEGEESFPDLVRAWSSGENPTGIEGVVWRLRGKRSENSLTSGDLIMNETAPCLPDLNKLPNPYTQKEDFAEGWFM
jgi:anaerobic magnesium-protoporphyrin IX monomethyl ester cyclase